MSEYIIKCRDLYLEGMTPSNIRCNRSNRYDELILIANSIIKNKGIDIFAGYLQEDHYFIDLWTAHILLQIYNNNLDKNLQIRCLNTIREHSDNPLSPIVSQEETEWLEQNEHKWR